MDVLFGVGVALLLGLPWVALMLSQPTATPSGYRYSAPARATSGRGREVGMSGAPLTDMPTSTTSREA
jgi:hypothetical protein